MFGSPFNDIIFEDDEDELQFKKRGVGRGHSAHGQRKRWKKRVFFEGDLVDKFNRELGAKAFKITYILTAKQITQFFETIKEQAIRPKESTVHSRNKLLLWLDRMHNCLSGQQMANRYHIGVQTAFSHIQDILRAILVTYNGKNIVRFPTMAERHSMVKILKSKNAYMPDALFAVDGSHLRCTGRHIAERRSRKYKWYVPNTCTLICSQNIYPSKPLGYPVLI